MQNLFCQIGKITSRMISRPIHRPHRHSKGRALYRMWTQSEKRVREKNRTEHPRAVGTITCWELDRGIIRRGIFSTINEQYQAICPRSLEKPKQINTHTPGYIYILENINLKATRKNDIWRKMMRITANFLSKIKQASLMTPLKYWVKMMNPNFYSQWKYLSKPKGK